MFKVRNTCVALKLLKQEEKRVGKITLPNNNECFGEAIVVAVGPGNVSAAGAVSETFDLKVGQRVYLETKGYKRNEISGGKPVLTIKGVEFRFEDETYYVYEQTSIIMILEEPSPDPEAGGIVPVGEYKKYS